LSTIYVMDAVVAKAQMAIDQAFSPPSATAKETENPGDVAQVVFDHHCHLCQFRTKSPLINKYYFLNYLFPLAGPIASCVCIGKHVHGLHQILPSRPIALDQWVICLRSPNNLEGIWCHSGCCVNKGPSQSLISWNFGYQ
jgi:hypothetical protein